jgi:hypothetical protein
MNKIAAILLIAAVALAMAAASGEASWKKRGWYQKKPGANCVMRKVVLRGYDGRTVVRTIRVCR